MIYQNDKNENTQNQFSNALKELQIGKLLRNANITKFMLIDRATKGTTETILFNIDIEGFSNKDKTAVLRVFAKMFYNHLGFYGENLKVFEPSVFVFLLLLRLNQLPFFYPRKLLNFPFSPHSLLFC